jgi:hypothetical protein
MKMISNDRILIASDLYNSCVNEAEKNVYTILEIDPGTGAISNRRVIPALPRSFRLMLDASRRPLLVSKSSIQVLDPTSLETTETINLNGLGTDAGVDKAYCGWNNLFRTSATPDSKLITLSVSEPNRKPGGVYQVDGATLKITQLPLEAFRVDFRTGFDGFYDNVKLRQWSWTNTVESRPVCEACNYVDVLSASNILITTNGMVFVRSTTDTIWNPKFSGERDSFDSTPAGNRFAILSAVGYTLFHHGLVFKLFVFDVPHRNVKQIQSFPVQQSGPITGDVVRSAVAFSPDGSQIAVFVNGRLTLISGL